MHFVAAAGAFRQPPALCGSSRRLATATGVGRFSASVSSLVTTEGARAALMAYKRQSFNVDPDDPEMQAKYKETSLGGLAVNVAAC